MRRSALALLSVSLFLAACSSQPQIDLDETEETVSSSSAPSVGITDEGASSAATSQDAGSQAAAGDVRRIEVGMLNWEFSPSAITAKQGEQVVLVVTGEEGEHGIAIPELGVDVKVAEGETREIPLPTDRTGTFSFRCNVPCGPGHREMTGTITIQA